MTSNKLINLIEKYNLKNLIKVIVILIILFLIYRIFVESKKNIYEGFGSTVSLGNTIYGNAISLLDPVNIPTYSNNICNFMLSDVYRIDALVFLLNKNTPKNPSDDSSFYDSNHLINITFLDGNGNTKNINATALKGKVTEGSPPTFIPESTSNLIKLTDIKDENGLPVFTSQINFNVVGNKSNIESIVDLSGKGYIEGFGIFGGDKNLPTQDAYNYIANTLTVDNNLTLSTNSSVTPIKNQSIYTFTKGTDSIIYSFKLTINISDSKLTDKPFIIKITYQNSIYSQNVFTINLPYIIRSDSNIVENNNTYAYIFLTDPIIANSVSFTVLHAPITDDVSNFVKLAITSATALNKVPSGSDISDYKQSINILQSSQDNADSSNVCPSINELVNTQTKTQEICDSLEYQDKVKSEKLRLERNKQYLIKLKDQQDQIEQLNSAIQSLEDARQTRAVTSDQLRVLQYQKQKSDASTIRDLANQRLESQDNNKLYMDINVNTT